MAPGMLHFAAWLISVVNAAPVSALRRRGWMFIHPPST